jgi:polyhydroxyalkanoate synthesis regulator phasin
MRDEVRRMALFGSGVAELTKHRAEGIVKNLVDIGDVGRKQASSVVKDLMESSRQNRKELMRFVRAEVQSQVENLGVATKRDVERLERRVVRLETAAASERAKKTAAKKTTRKASAKKSTARTRRASAATKPPLPETPPTV